MKTKKNLPVYVLLLMFVFQSSYGQNQTPLAKDHIRPESIDSTNIQFRQHPGAAHNAVVHEFTYLVAMQDFCNKPVLQMLTNGEVNKKFSKELERELSKAKAELASVKFNGLKIEPEYPELFLKKVNDQFRD